MPNLLTNLARNIFRQGTTAIDKKAWTEELQGMISPSQAYQVKYGDTTGDHFKLTIIGPGLQRDKALTLDMRFGPPAPGGDESPSIFIKGRGAEGLASEFAVGAKLVPKVRSGIPSDDDSPWELRSATRSLADLVAASIKSTGTQESTGGRARTVKEQMFGILSSDDPEKYAGVRQEFAIPRGLPQVWGEATPGEQIQIARRVGVVMPGSLHAQTGRGGYKKEEPDYESHFQSIGRALEGGDLPELTPTTPGQSFGGIYAPTRIGEGAYALDWAAKLSFTPRITSQDASGKETVESYIQHGLLWRADPIKHQKLGTSRYGARSPMMHAVYKDEDNVWQLLEPATTEQDAAHTVGQRAFAMPQAGMGISSPNIPAIVSGDAARSLIGLRKAGGHMPGEDIERDILAEVVLVGHTGKGPGSGETDPAVFEGIHGFAAKGAGKIVDLPYTDVDELLDHRITLTDRLRGLTLSAGTEEKQSLGTAGDDTSLDITTKQYWQQLTGGTLVIPQYYNIASGKFIVSKDAMPEDEQVNIASTAEIAKKVQKDLAQYDISVETTGSDVVPFLQLHTLQKLGMGGKGVHSVKQGGDTSMATKTRDRPTNMWIELDDGSIMPFSGLLQEGKQPVAEFAAGFLQQPLDNQIEMLRRIDPELGKWASSYVSGHQDPKFHYDDIERAYGNIYPEQPLDWMQIFAKGLAGFRNEKDADRNRENLMQFATGNLPSGGWVRGGIVTGAFKEYQEDLLNEMEKNDPTAVVDRSLIQYRPVKSGAPDTYEYYYRATPETSFVMLTTRGMAPEWPGKGTEINQDIMASVNRLYPKFAKSIGLDPEIGPMGGNPSMKRKSWLNAMTAYMWSESAARPGVEGGAKMPSDTPAEQAAQAATFTNIGPEEAGELLRSGMFDVGRNDMSEQAVMKALGNKLGWNILAFPELNRFMPSPEAITGIDVYDEAVDPGSSKAFYSTQYLNALKEVLQQATHATPQSDIDGAYARFMGGASSRLGKVVGNSKEMNRYLYGRDIAGAISGHYRVLYNLKPGEVFVPHEEMMRMGRQLGVTKKEDIDTWTDKLKEGGAEGLFWRYPTLSEEYGVSRVKMIDEEELRERGFNPTDWQSLEPGTIYVNPFTPEPFIGDEDLDPFGFMLGVRPTWGKDDQGNKILTGLDHILRDNSEAWTPTRENSEAALRRVVGGGSREFLKYSTQAAALKDYMTQQVGTRDPGTGKRLPPKGAIDRAEQLGTMPYKELRPKLRLLDKISQRRGTSHMAESAFKSAAIALNMPQDLIDQGAAGFALLYQGSLEYNEGATEDTSLEALLKTILFRADPGGKKDVSYAKDRDAVKLSQASSMGKEGPAWQPEQFHSGGAQPHLYNWLRGVMQNIGSMPEVPTSAIALGFADPQNLRPSVQTIKEMLADVPAEERGQVLSDRWEELLKARAVAPESVMGTALMGTAVSRTIKKASRLLADPETVKQGRDLRKAIWNVADIPWRGEQRSVEQLSQDPTIRTFRKLYEAKYARTTIPGETAIPSGSELESMVKQTKSSESIMARTLRGLLDYTGFGRGERVPETVLGQHTPAQAKEALERGPLNIAIGDIATINYGKAKWHAQTLMTRTAKWIGQEFGVAALTSKFVGHDPETEKLFERGNQYEMWLAGEEWTRWRHQVRAKGWDYEKILAGELPPGVKVQDLPAMPWTVVEHGSDDSNDNLISTKIAGVNIRGIEDLLRIEYDSEGRSVLAIGEAKLGKQQLESAKVQVGLYREGLLRMHADTKPGGGREQLVKLLESRKKQADTLYRGLTGKESGLGANFVSQALEAISARRITTSLISGTGSDPKIFRDLQPGEERYSIPGGQRSATGVMTESRVDTSKYDYEDIVSGVRTTIQESLGDTWRKLSQLFLEGESGDIKLREGFRGVSPRTLNPITELLQRHGHLAPRSNPVTNMLTQRRHHMAAPTGTRDPRQQRQQPGGDDDDIRRQGAGFEKHLVNQDALNWQTEGAVISDAPASGDQWQLSSNRDIVAMDLSTFQSSVEAQVDNARAITELISFLGGGGAGGAGGAGGGAGGGARGGGGRQQWWSSGARGLVTENIKAGRGIQAYEQLTADPSGEGRSELQLYQSEIASTVNAYRQQRAGPGVQVGMLSDEEAAEFLPAALGTSSFRRFLAQQPDLIKRVAKVRKAASAIQVGAGAAPNLTDLTPAEQVISPLMQMSVAGPTPESIAAGVPDIPQVAKQAARLETALQLEGVGATAHLPKLDEVREAELTKMQLDGAKMQRDALDKNSKELESNTKSVLDGTKTQQEAIKQGLISAETLEEFNENFSGGQAWIDYATATRRKEQALKGLQELEVPTEDDGKYDIEGIIAGGGEAGLTMQEFAEAELAQDAAGRAIGAGVKGTGKEGRSAKIARASRHIFGGFGWMYMQRVAGMGISSLAEGYQEGQAYEAASQREAAQAYGVGVAPAAQTPSMARQQALVRAGGMGYGTGQTLMSNITGTGAGDALAVAKGGFGMGLGAMFLGGEMVGAGLLAKGALGPLAIGAGVVGMAATAAAQQISYAQNPEWSMARAAAGRRRELAGELGSWDANYTMLGPGIKEAVGEMDWKDWLYLGLGGESDIVYQTGERHRAERDVMARRAGDYLAGKTTPISAADTEKIIATIIGDMRETIFESITPEIVDRAIRTTSMAGMGVQAAGRYAQQLQAGLPIDQLSQELIQAINLPFTAETLGAVIPGTAGNIFGVTQQRAGAAAIGSLGPVAQEQLDLYQMDPRRAANIAPQYAALQQTPYWSTLTRQAQLAERAYNVGAQYQIEVPDRFQAPAYDPGAIQAGRAPYATIARLSQQERRDLAAQMGWDEQMVGYQEQRGPVLGGDVAAAFVAQMQDLQGRERAFGLESAAMAEQVFNLTGNLPGAQATLAGAVGTSMMGSPAFRNIVGGMLSGSPQDIVRGMFPNMQGVVDRPFIPEFGMAAPVDINQLGQVTSAPMYTSSLPLLEYQQLGGAGGSRFAQAGFEGVQIGATTGLDGPRLFGIPGMRYEQQLRQREMQTFQLNQAQQGLGLQRQYFQGGGQFGRGLWAVQDDLRAQGIEQQRWQYDMQERGMVMGRRQFQENIALNMQQSQVSRGFQRDMWGFQDTQRQMQWGWKQEDFEESSRFMTGRQRRLAERQMERDTIMYGMGEEQVEKQKEYQEELWQLEDQRFELQKSHYEENFIFQKEQLDKQREYFEARTVLEAEQLEITRTYQLAQFEQQQKNLTEQQAFNEEMNLSNDELAILAENSRLAIAEWGEVAKYTDAISQIFDRIEEFIKEMEKAGLITTKKPSYDPNNNIPQQHGGHSVPGLSYLVGELEPEIFRPLHAGTVTPYSKWRDSTIMTNNLSASSTSQMPINIYIGDRHLGNYVLDTVSRQLEIV